MTHFLIQPSALLFNGRSAFSNFTNLPSGVGHSPVRWGKHVGHSVGCPLAAAARPQLLSGSHFTPEKVVLFLNECKHLHKTMKMLVEENRGCFSKYLYHSKKKPGRKMEKWSILSGKVSLNNTRKRCEALIGFIGGMQIRSCQGAHLIPFLANSEHSESKTIRRKCKTRINW